MDIVTKTTLGKWLFKAHLEYQRRKGQRSTIGEFARALGISRAYLTMLINGDREAISLDVAHRIFEKLGDITIYDAAGYPRPNLATEAIRPILEQAPELSPEAIEELKAMVRKYLEAAGWIEIE